MISLDFLQGQNHTAICFLGVHFDKSRWNPAIVQFYDRDQQLQRNTWMEQVKSHLRLHKHTLEPLQLCFFVCLFVCLFVFTWTLVLRFTSMEFEMALKSKRSTETFQGTRGSGFTKWKKKKKKNQSTVGLVERRPNLFTWAWGPF